MQCRNGGEMSEWRRREEIVIYIDCDVVVVHVPFLMLSQSHSTSTQYKLYYNANHFSDEMYTLPGKGINVWSWNTMSTTKTMLVHLVSVNLKGTLVATTSRICVFFCWTVTWPTSSTVWPFLSLRSRLCQEESQIDHIGCVGLKEIRSSAVCGGLGASYIIILNPDSFSNLHSHLHSIVPAMIDASPSVLLFIHSIRACISHLPACY